MAPKRAAPATDISAVETKKPRKEKVPKMPSMTAMSSATKEDLLQFLKNLCSKYPEIRDDVREFKPDLPIQQMLAEIEKAANQVGKKMPWDKYGYGNRDTYAYKRVRPFISAFAKVVTAHLKSVEKSGQLDKLAEFVDGCEDFVNDMHEFAAPEHNATKQRLRKAIDKAGKKLGREAASLEDEDASDAELELE
mmetsp:Transcript_59558/g.141717  ORF Transcript_59558/g.141717 Transcript_59558/m.141717 type:complete len:193 (-) Transcript_59558:129-707(-)